MKIDDMRVGDFLYLLDCMQEECCEHKRCSKCRYIDFCDIDIPSIDSLSIRRTVEGYAEAKGLLEHMHYATSENEMKWIPVSECLPEDLDNRFYMCILENHEDDLPVFMQYDDELGFGYWIDRFHPQTLGYLCDEFKTTEDLGYEKVIAWMEIPEYKGETENVD